MHKLCCLLASCTPAGALLAAYVVLKLLRPALLETRVGFMCTRRCLASWDTNSALLCYGYYASSCRVYHYHRVSLRTVVQDCLHTYECSVGVHRCWMLAQACYVRVSALNGMPFATITLGTCLSMTLRGLLRRLGDACCCSLRCSYMLKCSGIAYYYSDYMY